MEYLNRGMEQVEIGTLRFVNEQMYPAAKAVECPCQIDDVSPDATIQGWRCEGN